MSDSKKPSCKDCIEEGIVPPRPRYKKTSYCMQHNYTRSKRSTKAAKLRRIIESQDWKGLEQRDRFGAPLFSHGEIAPFLERWKRTAEEATLVARQFTEKQKQKDITEFARAWDQAREAYEVVMALQKGTQPSKVELSKIPAMIIPPDPLELQRIDNAAKAGAYVEPEGEVDLDAIFGAGDESSNTRMPGKPS